MDTPPTFRSRSHGIPIPICVFRRRGWYWVSTPTVSIPELMQLLNGKSIIRYFPPKATAGFATFDVKDKNARDGVNPLTGEKVLIEACKAPVIKFSKTYKELFNK